MREHTAAGKDTQLPYEYQLTLLETMIWGISWKLQ